jgi:hypothetical protein
METILKQALTEVLNQMPEIFSSNQFVRSCRKKQIHEQIIHSGMIAKFLKNHASKYGSSKRMWIKRATEINVIDFKEQECIDYLKSKGFKVMKPVNKFVEI